MSKRNSAGGIRIDRRLRSDWLAQSCSALLDNACRMFLHITAKPSPVFGATAQRGQIVEICVACGEGFELLAVIEFALVARAVDKPDLLALAAIGAVLLERATAQSRAWERRPSRWR